MYVWYDTCMYATTHLQQISVSVCCAPSMFSNVDFVTLCYLVSGEECNRMSQFVFQMSRFFSFNQDENIDVHMV